MAHILYTRSEEKEDDDEKEGEKAPCNVGHLNSRKDLKGQPVSALEAAFQTGPQDKTRAFSYKRPRFDSPPFFATASSFLLGLLSPGGGKKNFLSVNKISDDERYTNTWKLIVGSN